MTDITWPNFSSYVKTITSGIMNEIKTCVNSKSDSDHTHTTYLENSISSLSDLGWTGQYETTTAGESLTSADFGKPFYIYNDSGTTKIKIYKSGSAYSHNDTYPPAGIILSSGTIAAGGSVTVSIGPGVFRDDSLSLSAGDRGKYLYIAEAGGWTTTAPSATGSWVVFCGRVRDVSPDLIEVVFPTYGYRND